MKRVPSTIRCLSSPSGRAFSKLQYPAFSARYGNPSILWHTPKHTDYLGQRIVPERVLNRQGETTHGANCQIHISQEILHFAEKAPHEHIVNIDFIEMLMGFPFEYTKI